MPAAATDRPLHEIIWRAPLVPVALAFTAGIVIDRHLPVAWPKSLATIAALCFVALAARRHGPPALLQAILLLALVPLGMAWHCARQRLVAADDIRFAISPEGTIARLRGVIDAEPVQVRPPLDDALRSFPGRGRTRLIVRAEQLQQQGAWQEASGLIQVAIPEPRHDLQVGAEVELVGTLTLPAGPANPGELDYAAYLGDQGISALLSAPASPGAVEVLRESRAIDVHRWLAKARGWGIGVLERYLPEGQRGIAAALLLGDNSAVSAHEWEQYLRTGVTHVLAISGQHLVVLAWLLWHLARFCGGRPWSSAALIAVGLLGYAVLTGGRPPVMRAAWMVLACAGGVILQRPVLRGNAFALAWLIVAASNPADIFGFGCQLSFIAVAVFMWGASRWSGRDADPLERVVEESRSWLESVCRRGLRWLAVLYAVNVGVWLAVMPLIVARQHVLSPVALLVGPPMVLIGSAALLLGIALLLAALIGGPLAWLFACLTNMTLALGNVVTAWSSGLPGAFAFLPDVPEWWLALFYLGLLACLMLPLGERLARGCWLGMGVWLCLGTILVLAPPRVHDFRCTYLAVGHGGCVVLETPGGKTFVYDAGALNGPEVTRRTIAPFLWNRGIRRIDELLISHGDLDHFNGVPDLVDRFAVERVTLTPSFADRRTPGVGHTLRAFEKRGLSTKVVSAGDSWQVDGISFEVLHPPPRGPDGNENARSLVLLVRFQDLSLLLSGDLEGPGLTRLLELPPERVDVLQAPHHGSRFSNTQELAAWARPAVVVSSQGPPRSVAKEANAYEKIGARYLTTWPHGAITIRPEGAAFVVETFHTRHRWAIR